MLGLAIFLQLEVNFRGNAVSNLVANCCIAMCRHSMRGAPDFTVEPLDKAEQASPYSICSREGRQTET